MRYYFTEKSLSYVVLVKNSLMAIPNSSNVEKYMAIDSLQAENSVKLIFKHFITLCLLYIKYYVVCNSDPTGLNRAF